MNDLLTQFLGGVAVGRAVTKTFPDLGDVERMEVVGQFMAGTYEANDERFIQLVDAIDIEIADISKQVATEYFNAGVP